MTDVDQLKERILSILELEEKAFRALGTVLDVVQDMIELATQLGLDAPMIANVLQLVRDNIVASDTQLDLVKDKLTDFYNRL